MELLNSLLSNLIIFIQKFSKLTTSAQIAITSVLLLCTNQLTTCTKDQEIENIKMNAQKTTQYVETISDSLKTLNDDVEKKQVKIEKLSFEISLQKKQRSTLKITQNRLEQLRIVETDTVTIIALQDTTIDNLKSQLTLADVAGSKKDTIIAQQDSSIGLLKHGLQLSEQRADTLQKTLNSTIEKINKKDKIFGFIPMPSRKTVAVTAIIGGVYLGTQLKK